MKIPSSALLSPRCTTFRRLSIKPSNFTFKSSFRTPQLQILHQNIPRFQSYSTECCGGSQSSLLNKNTQEPKEEPVTVHFTIQDRDNDMIECEAKTGELLSSVALRNHSTLECACGEVMACSTCHVYLPVELYDTLDFPSEGEDDLLDQVVGLVEDSSRLACQVRITKNFEGKVIKIPKEHINLLD